MYVRVLCVFNIEKDIIYLQIWVELRAILSSEKYLNCPIKQIDTHSEYKKKNLLSNQIFFYSIYLYLLNFFFVFHSFISIETSYNNAKKNTCINYIITHSV